MYKRILLKLSGEALKADSNAIIDPETVKGIAAQIKQIYDLGTEIGIVVGGGNIWRGKIGEELGMERAQADYMGMLATIMNGLSIQDALEGMGVPTRCMTALPIDTVAEPYIRRKMMKHLEKNRVVIFGAGTGNPYFTTDTAAALRAAEMEADVILVGKTIDGVYSADPKKDENAIKYKNITYTDILSKNLKVMDSTAISLCRDNHIPLVIFAIEDPNNICKIINGEDIGTTVNE